MSTPTHVQFTISLVDLEHLYNALEEWESADINMHGFNMVDKNPEITEKVIDAAMPLVGGDRASFDKYLSDLRAQTFQKARTRRSFSLRLRGQINEIINNPTEHAVPTIQL